MRRNVSILTACLIAGGFLSCSAITDIFFPKSTGENETMDARIVYVSTCGDAFNNQVMLLDVGEGTEARLTHDLKEYFHPQFTPDGEKVLFYSNDPGNHEIYLMNSDGSHQINLTNRPGDDYLPAVSPDGSKIVFVSERDGNPEIYLMNADGSDPVRVTVNEYVDHAPTFSPDGSKIAFYALTTAGSAASPGSVDIFIAHSDGSNLRRLTSEGDYRYYTEYIFKAGFASYDTGPRFSPDGSKIVFIAEILIGYNIHTMNVDGTDRRTITAEGGHNVAPFFTPDGDRILFKSHRAGSHNLYTVDVNGGTPFTLIQTSGHTEFGDFSPDGSQILYCDDLPHYNLYTVRLDGTGISRLTENTHADVFPRYCRVAQ